MGGIFHSSMQKIPKNISLMFMIMVLSSTFIILGIIVYSNSGSSGSTRTKQMDFFQ
jgi:hypothetical protein